MKFEKIIDGLTDEIEFMIGMGTAPLVQEAARRELQAQQQEIAELKQLAETKNARTLERIGRIERQEREIAELKEWQRKAFDCYPNIDIDIEGLET